MLAVAAGLLVAGGGTVTYGAVRDGPEHPIGVGPGLVTLLGLLLVCLGLWTVLAAAIQGGFMSIESFVSMTSALWHISPVRWMVYGAVLLAVLYIYVMRLKRIRENEGLSLPQKVIGGPIAAFAVFFNWFYNLTANSLLYREPPHSWKELTTQRLQRALDNPGEYAGYRLWIARKLKPWLNHYDRGHLE